VPEQAQLFFLTNQQGRSAKDMKVQLLLHEGSTKDRKGKKRNNSQKRQPNFLAPDSTIKKNWGFVNMKPAR